MQSAPALSRLLRVESPRFVAGAVFVREPSARGGWRCTEAAPILRRQLLGADAVTAKRRMESCRHVGWRYSWVAS